MCPGGDGDEFTRNLTNANPLSGSANPLVGLGIINVKDGKIQKGWATHWGDEILGEVNGTNAKRAEANKASDALDEATARRQIELANEAQRNQQTDINNSLMAAGVRRTGLARAASVAGRMVNYGSGGQSATTSGALKIAKEFLGV